MFGNFGLIAGGTSEVASLNMQLKTTIEYTMEGFETWRRLMASSKEFSILGQECIRTVVSLDFFF